MRSLVAADPSLGEPLVRGRAPRCRGRVRGTSRDGTHPRRRSRGERKHALAPAASVEAARDVADLGPSSGGPTRSTNRRPAYTQSVAARCESDSRPRDRHRRAHAGHGEATALPAHGSGHGKVAPAFPAFDTNVTWSDCGDGWQCGTLTVPVNWRKPTAYRWRSLAGRPVRRTNGSVCWWSIPVDPDSAVPASFATWCVDCPTSCSSASISSAGIREEPVRRAQSTVSTMGSSTSARRHPRPRLGGDTRRRCATALRTRLHRTRRHVRRSGRHPELGTRPGADPHHARRAHPQLPGILLRHRPRDDVRTDVPERGREP